MQALPATMTHFHSRQFLLHGLIVAGVCTAIAAIQAAYGRGPWHAQLVYSMSIGMVSWLMVEVGRLWLTRDDTIPWPLGWRGWMLVAVSGTIGFHAGSAIGDAYCRALQLPSHAPPPGDPGSAVLTTVLACVAVSLFFYAQGKSRYLEGRIAQAQRDTAEARLKLLQTQLEPHMMFNTLANLRALIGADPPQAQAMLDHFIAYLRATLGASRAAAHPLADEFALLRDYLELMAVRMGPRLSYALDLPESLEAVSVPPLLLQPLVENAIRHGLEPQVEGGRIEVTARLAPGPSPRLELSVLDTGAGLRPGRAGHGASPGSGSRFGLAQVRERLATLEGPRATLDLVPGDGGRGARACIFLPLGLPAAPAGAAAGTDPENASMPCKPPVP
ncbi:sensor histidine kinase [Paracidovorax avenae]|nr:sensor histidine kinase [Paracidovorax avenae]